MFKILLQRCRIYPQNACCTPKSSLSTLPQPEYKTVYKFPYIRGVSIIGRLKVYQTILTSIMVPGSTILNQFNLCTTDEVIWAIILGVSGIVPLYTLGYFSNKLVGIAYLNEDNKLAKLSYLDFWGRRKNIEIPISDIVPISELPRTLTSPFYLNLRQFSKQGTLKLCYKYGIIDNDGFNKIFS